MAYKRTTKDTWEVQVDYGYGDGFEFVAGYDSRKEALLERSAYVANAPQYPTRVKMVRSKVTESPPLQIKKKEYSFEDWLNELDCLLVSEANMEHVGALVNTPYRKYYDKGTTPAVASDLIIRDALTSPAK